VVFVNVRLPEPPTTYKEVQMPQAQCRQVGTIGGGDSICSA